ncbi:MAG: hypothetical protein NZM12_02210, partial [Steroidobacteraceae bacterium]|nr:hypothetical protein [Steroidobacteraceae bacterium]
MLSTVLQPRAAHAQLGLELQVSEYLVAPNPIGRGDTATFTVRVTNNGSNADGALVVIDVAANFEVVAGSFPASCTLLGPIGAQQLRCPQASFPSGANVTFSYDAIARAVTPPSRTTTATIGLPTAPPDPPDISGDSNPGNNSLTITPTVRAGTDLSITKTSERSSYVGGETVVYTLTPRIGGPDTTTAIRVTDNLPPQADLDNITVTGPGGAALTNWSCSVNTGVPNVVCDYTGATPAPPANLPPFEIRGRVARGISGTITNSAFMSLTANTILEINPNNDSSGNVVINVAPGADLQAQKAMAPNPVATSSPVTLTLTVRNLGPATVANAQIVDNVPAGFVIGTLPAGCVAAGQQITCTTGTLSGSGGAQTFTIPLTSPASAVVGTNTATVTPPAGITDPLTANNSASVDFTVQQPFADLLASKAKTGGPVNPTATLISTITITNSATSLSAATYSPANPLVFTEQLGPNEQFTGVLTAGWNCTPAASPGAPVPGPVTITCASTGSGVLPIGGSISVQLRTTPFNIGTTPPFPNLVNTVCAGSTGGSQHIPADPSSGPEQEDCASAAVVATSRTSNLTVVKDVNTDNTGVAGPRGGNSLTVPAGDTDFFIRLAVTNLGPDVAPTAIVSDTLPNYLNDAGFTTSVSFPVVPAGTSCQRDGATVACTLTDLGVGETRTVIVRVERPFESGSVVNTATVRSPDAVDPDPSNDADTATIVADPIADVTIPSDGKNINPDPARVGQVATYTISFRNRGPNPASNVFVRDVVDLQRFDVLAGSITTTAPDP